MYKVIMQFIPNVDQIWVTKLNPDDPEYIYSTEQEAVDKAAELQAADPTGRKYKASLVETE
jgi:hypothetical protein